MTHGHLSCVDCNEPRGGEHGHSKRPELSHSAEVVKEEQVEESTAVCLKPWKGQLWFNVTGNIVGEMESVGERLGSSVPGPETKWRCLAGTKYMSLELRRDD